MPNFEEILHSINGFGLYQKQKLALICYSSLLTPIVTYINIFITPYPDHSCKAPYASNNPLNGSINEEKCWIRINDTVQHCTAWNFDKEHYSTTLTEEWGLVCEYNFLRAKIRTFFFLGFVFGSPILGKLADKIGRRKVVCLSALLVNIGTFGSAFGVQDFFGFRISYTLFIISGFLSSFATRGIDETGYVLALELIGAKESSFAAIMLDLFFAGGHLILAIGAYFLRDWRELTMATFIFVLPLISFFGLIPESPRWLISNNRHDEAFKILKDIAITNKTSLCDDKWKKFCSTESSQENEENESFKKCYKYPYFILVLIGVAIMWIVENVVFFGLGMKTNDLGVNPYFSFGFAAILEILAVLSTFPIIDKFGRKGIFFWCVFLGGLFSMTIAFIENVTAVLVLAMIFKFLTTIAYAVMRLYSTEIFPTTIRVTCVALCSLVGRVFVLFVPTINAVGIMYWKPLPFMIYGIFGLLGAFVVSLLPETFRKNPAENLDEFNQIFKSDKAHQKRVIYDSNKEETRELNS